MTDALADKLKHLPTSPGVYQHKDAEGTTLYVGKAKNLRSRVRSYFQDGRPREGRIQALVKKVADVEVIVTDTEAEALILENNLIKRLKPRYNVLLKDDKSYPFICVKNERFPRVFPTRTVRRDGSAYYGPYTDAKAMKLVLKTIKDLFKLRSCSLHLNEAAIEADKYQPCLDYHIQKCAAPCVGYETEAHYDTTIRQIKTLLEGKTGELQALLKEEMVALAADKKFEEAAEYRDRLAALKKYSEKQKVVTDQDVDRDLFALAVEREDDVAVGVLFKVREGKIVGRQHKVLRGIEGTDEPDLMQRFVDDHYASATFYPDEVYLAGDLAMPSAVEEYLREARGKKVEVRVPQRGEKVDLMNMVEANARLLLGEWQLQKEKRDEDRIPRSVLSLQRDLRLKNPPPPDRVLRHLAPGRDGDGRELRRLPGREAAEVGLPDVQDPDGRVGQARRLPVDARGRRAPLRPAPPGERPVAGPRHHRRREGTALVVGREPPQGGRVRQVPGRGPGEASGGGPSSRARASPRSSRGRRRR